MICSVVILSCQPNHLEGKLSQRRTKETKLEREGIFFIPVAVKMISSIPWSDGSRYQSIISWQFNATLSNSDFLQWEKNPTKMDQSFTMRMNNSCMEKGTLTKSITEQSRTERERERESLKSISTFYDCGGPRWHIYSHALGAEYFCASGKTYSLKDRQ